MPFQRIGERGEDQLKIKLMVIFFSPVSNEWPSGCFRTMRHAFESHHVRFVGEVSSGEYRQEECLKTLFRVDPSLMRAIGLTDLFRISSHYERMGIVEIQITSGFRGR